MNVYIWKHLETVSNRYHSDGGLVVFAKSLERAIELANNYEDDERSMPVMKRVTPDDIPTEYRKASGPERVYVFPDAGCC